MKPLGGRNHQPTKSQPPAKNITNLALLKTDSTAADENRKRLHSLGNQQQSLPMSSGPPTQGTAGVCYRDTHTLQNTLGQKPLLSNMLKNQNLLEDDGIEDLHFYFVEFNQHKRNIVQHQRTKSANHAAARDAGTRLLKTTSVQQKTIESCEEDLF